MELIIETDGLFHLVKLTEKMMEHIKLLNQVDCFELCNIVRLEFTTYYEPFNKYLMNNGTGNLYGCICK